MRPVVTVEHIRQHVIEDAGDLISLMGVTDPLIASGRLHDADDKAHAGRLLRRLLSRNLVLVICRLHEKADNGRTGQTASIDALIDIAAVQLSDFTRAEELKAKRLAIIAETEADIDGFQFSAIRDFRTAELAHSLHRVDTSSDSTVTYRAVVALGKKTYDLVLEIEQELCLCGLTPFSDLPHLAEAWERRGKALWFDALR